MGISPPVRGISSSSRGIEARLAISMVTTNSDGSICPTCRLPMSRITPSSAKYITTVRNTATIHSSHIPMPCPGARLRLSKKWSFRASAHTGVGIPP